MAKWLNKYLILFTGICLALAVFEIHGESSHNTFFDQDDTYVQSNNQNVEIGAQIEKQGDLFQALNDFASDLFDEPVSETKIISTLSSQRDISFNPPKIFLRNSVWLI